MSDRVDIVEWLLKWRDRFGVDIAGPETPERCEEAAKEIARLREERLTISTLLGKVETLEADNERLREERRAFCTVDGYPGKFEIKPLPPGPEANG